MAQHEHDKKEPEELEVESYMDQFSKSEDAPSDEDRVKRYQLRYQFVKDEARRLQMEREEIEAGTQKNKDQMLVQIRDAFSANYKTRKTVVTELRKLGQKIEDRFIPNSAS